MNTDEILAERQKTHGSFSLHSAITQNIKDLLHRTYDDGCGWKQLDQSQKECLEMIAHKIGRILAGNPNFKDHWDDIAGYATLVSRQLEQELK
jgi:hypothetical protein